MIFSGTFKTYDNNQTYSITIGKSGTIQNIVDPTDNIYGQAAPSMIVMFGPDPVTVNCDRQDLMKRIIISQATINLYSNQDLTEYLFADTNRDIPVTITLNSSHVFYGFVDPLQFNQGYAYNYESISISATDPLGALEDKKVSPTDATINPSSDVAPWTILTTILNKVGVTNITESINATVKSTMQNTKIHCNIFFGDSQDDWKSYYDVLNTICKYFNLYIAMNGKNSVILTSTINNTVTAVNITNFKDKATDDSTSISTDDVYSQISLTCNIEPEPDLVQSFTDSDLLYSDYSDFVRYMTEYVSYGEGKSAWDAFYNIINNNYTIYDGAVSIDHWCYVFRNDAWDFGANSYIDYLGGSINHSTGATTPCVNDQRSLLTWLAGAPFRAALVGYAEMNKIMLNGATQDNSLEKTPALYKCLVISTMGQFKNDETEFNRYQALVDYRLNNNVPICKYTGIDSNVLSPGSENIVNFIVINGSLRLNPLQMLTGPNWENRTDTLSNYWNVCRQGFVVSHGRRNCWHYTVPYPSIDDGAYYNQYWHYGSNGVYGKLTNSSNKEYEYEYSSAGDTDNISKMPVLYCQMKVTTNSGTVKYCVERLDGGSPIHAWTDKTGQNTFEWLTAEECTQNNLKPYFTIGIDPKIGDYIIGEDYNISNTVDWRYNLDKTGMCIPIHMQDELSGTIEFSIISPCNMQWDNYTLYPFGFFFRANAVCILSNIQSIMLSDLKIEMTSNNGGINREKTGADNDLVYYSDMNPKYLEKQDDDIDICSCLTVEQYTDLGIKIQNSNSYVMNANNSGFMGFNNGAVKPEACYVDYMYKEYSSPAKMLDTQLTTASFSDGMYGNTMNYEMLTNYFTGLPVVGNCRLMSYSSDLKYKTITCRFRQHKTITNVQI